MAAPGSLIVQVELSERFPGKSLACDGYLSRWLVQEPRRSIFQIFGVAARSWSRLSARGFWKTLAAT